MNKPSWEINKERFYYKVDHLYFYIINVKNEGRFDELLESDSNISNFISQYNNFYDYLQKHFTESNIESMIQSAKCFTKVR